MMTLLRNSMLYLNASLWLGVLYLSLCEDGKAAVLSYVSLALTVLMTKYGFWDKYICASVVTGFISKVLIIGGILLAIFPRFWNFSFYSVCLGFLVQKMKCERESRANNVCSNINMTVLNDIKDEFKPIISQKSPIQLQKDRKESQMKKNKINDTNEIDKSNYLFRIVPEHSKAKELEKTCEDKAASSKNYCNKLPLNFPEIVSNHVSVSKDLLKSNKNILIKNENIKAQCINFIKQDELTLKHHEKLFDSIYGSSLLKMKDPRGFALTEGDLSNIKLELKQIEERNCKFPKKSTAVSDSTQKKNIFRDDMLKQLCIIADMLENINRQKNEMRKELANAQDSINSLVQQDATKNISNLLQQNLDNVKDEFHQKSVRTFDDEVNLRIFNKSINLDIDGRLEKSNRIVEGTHTEIDSESSASKIDFQRENCSETDETSKPRTKHKSLISVKSTDIQHANEKCSRELKGIREQITEIVNSINSPSNDLKNFPVSEKSLEPKVLNNSMNADFNGEISSRNELDNSAEKENWTDDVRKPSENVGVVDSPTVADVEGVVNRIDLGFIYAV